MNNATAKIRIVGKREVPMKDTGRSYRPESMEEATMQAYHYVVISADRIGCTTGKMLLRVNFVFIVRRICNLLMGHYR